MKIHVHEMAVPSMASLRGRMRPIFGFSGLSRSPQGVLGSLLGRFSEAIGATDERTGMAVTNLLNF